MDYPLPDFVRDYKDWSKIMLEARSVTKTDAQYWLLAKAFFHKKYGVATPLAEDRFQKYKTCWDAIDLHQKELQAHSLHVRRPKKTGSLIRGALILAVHHLVIEKGISKPTFEQFLETSSRFSEPESKST